MAAGGSQPVVAGSDAVVYWDSSAVLSAVFQDSHSVRATAAAKRPGLHLFSALAWAEVHAVIARIERERVLARVLVEAAREAVELGPWRPLNVSPEWGLMRDLSRRWELRGTDLWHLSAAKTLQPELPGLKVLTFDSRLAAASRGEGL